MRINILELCNQFPEYLYRSRLALFSQIMFLLTEATKGGARRRAEYSLIKHRIAPVILDHRVTMNREYLILVYWATTPTGRRVTDTRDDFPKPGELLSFD